jgi:hypothetical protein
MLVACMSKAAKREGGKRKRETRAARAGTLSSTGRRDEESAHILRHTFFPLSFVQWLVGFRALRTYLTLRYLAVLAYIPRQMILSFIL